MNVLSLFDGISCGRVALDRALVNYGKYYASEIDRYAITIAQKNYPDTVQLGDIINWRSWDLSEIDLIMGGSPCQGFSFAGKQLNFEDSRSKLFFEFVNIVNHYKPRYFLLENVRMKKEYQDVISDALGVEPICINSALVSAQNRVRYYWTNIRNVIQPEDKHVILKDILQDDSELCCRMVGRKLDENGIRKDYDKQLKTYQYIEPRLDRKSNCLTTVQKDCLVLLGLADNIKGFESRRRVYSTEGKSPTLLAASGGQSEPKIAISGVDYRNLTTTECERLQTLPDNYTDVVSNRQRYKAIGNGWTVDVIAHIFQGLRS